MESIEPHQVMTRLLKLGILSTQDRADIITLWKERDRKTVLLTKIAAKMDFSIFEKFLDALVDTNDVAIAEKLRSQCEFIWR